MYIRDQTNLNDLDAITGVVLQDIIILIANKLKKDFSHYINKKLISLLVWKLQRVSNANASDANIHISESEFKLK
ncbi:9704_t:CDS:2, partial [Racocetra fulgida]